MQSIIHSLLSWQVALVCIMAACAPTPVSGAGPDVIVVLQVTEERNGPSPDGFSDDEFEVAGRTVRALLATAGIPVEWRNCRAVRADCDLSTPGAVGIEVRLQPQAKSTDPLVCGDVTLDHLGTPVVVVYLAPHVDLTPAFRFNAAVRSAPWLRHLRMGHLVGLTVAHEVGHSLGLAHASSGVMKARPAIDEVAALVAQRLTFAPAQVSRLRLALHGRSTAIVASTR